jgi:hypothetical protein
MSCNLPGWLIPARKLPAVYEGNVTRPMPVLSTLHAYYAARDDLSPVAAFCQKMFLVMGWGLTLTGPFQLASRIAFIALLRVAESMRSMNSTPSR